MRIKNFLAIVSALCIASLASAVEPTRVRCVLSEEARMHLAPDDDALAWPVARFTPLHHVDTSGDWHLVRDLDNDLFWIHNRYVTANDYLVCGVIRAEQTDARRGPGEEYEEAGKRYRYTGLRIVEYADGWVRGIDSDAQDVWVPEEAVLTF